MEEQEHLLPHTEESFKRESNNCSCEDWTDNSSCSSYYSDSDSSSVAEWESSIESTGELLFIDCDPVVSQINPDEFKPPDTFSKTETRRSTRSKFLKLLRRKDSKRRSKRLIKSQESQDTTKVKFHDDQEGEERQVLLKVDQNIRKLGRRVDLIESLLGLTISTLSDGNRVMVSGFVPEKEAARQKGIKIGDWLKSINDEQVFYNNLNNVLERLVNENEITLKLQRVVGIEVTKNPPRNELSNQSTFVQQLICKQLDIDDVLLDEFRENSMGLLYINTNNLREDGGESDGILYSFPPTESQNLLSLTRGAFITLNDLLKDVISDTPQSTSVLYKEQLVHIVYTNFESKILLFMLPDRIVLLNELISLNNQLLRIVKFVYQSIDNCIQNERTKQEFDAFILRFFAKLLKNHKFPIRFEDSLMECDFLSLPDEIQMQIDDSLSELEACDYREWNDDPLDCQRLFTILGSAFFHSSHLLATHFNHQDLIDVVLYCKHNGIFHLSRSEPVRSLVLWKQVFPSSCLSPNFFPDIRQYLLIVGSGKDLLVTLMEAGGCTEPPEDNMGPDPFYVEEVQATLSHLQDIGIPSLADRWMENHNKKIVLPQVKTKKKTDFLGHIITKSTQVKDSPVPVQKKQQVTSILKRRSSDQFLVNSLITLEDSEICSEDSTSQGERSEFSDEPVLGRRATREKQFDSDEESDIEDYRDGSQSSNSYDFNELRQSLLESRDGPGNFTSGTENVLFHYVHLDASKGILLCPLETQHTKALDIILESFRQTAHNIHKIFENTIRFKDISSQNISKCMMNKNLVAIKEYGSLFECNLFDESSKKFGKITFWVVGKLFDIPHPREMFVCYQDSVPQNIIEIAFKLGISLVT